VKRIDDYTGHYLPTDALIGGTRVWWYKS